MKNKSFKMLCIDASTKHFGFALYENGILKDVFGYEFKDVFSLEKLASICAYFSDTFSMNKDIKHVVVEQPVPMQFSQAVVQINQVVGALFGVCFEHQITFDWVHNRTAKKLAGITKKGKEAKQEGIDLMKTRYPEFADKIINDHIADAIIVGEAYKMICLDEKSTKGYTTVFSEVK